MKGGISLRPRLRRPLSKLPDLGKALLPMIWGRAQGDGPKVTEPNLRFPAVFCENLLRFSAVSCALQNAVISRRGGEPAKICGFLRKSAFSALSLSLSLSGQSPEKFVYVYVPFPFLIFRPI